MPKNPTPLRLAIVHSGRTQRDIADEVGLSETRLSQIVNGHWNADHGTRTALASVLGLHVNDVFPPVPTHHAEAA